MAPRYALCLTARVMKSMTSKKLKPYNGGQWTEARFHSFIKGGLRNISLRWGPKNEVKKAARISRGVYMCAGYGREAHETTASLPPKPGNKRRINNAVVDHKTPIIDPKVGFVSWDQVIERMFCEQHALQVLCHNCHSRKTQEERKQRDR